jgi:uncharacterized protein (DUF2342 family)
LHRSGGVASSLWLDSIRPQAERYNEQSAFWLEIENDRGLEVADEITNAHPEHLRSAEIEIRRWRETAG